MIVRGPVLPGLFGDFVADRKGRFLYFSVSFLFNSNQIKLLNFLKNERNNFELFETRTVTREINFENFRPVV